MSLCSQLCQEAGTARMLSLVHSRLPEGKPQRGAVTVHGLDRPGMVGSTDFEFAPGDSYVAESRISRTLSARVSWENGFLRKAMSDRSTPLRTTASSV